MIYKKILLAIDGSDASLPALQEAIRLAGDQKALLRVIYVVDESFIYHGGPGYDYLSFIESCREEGQAILSRTSDYIKTQSKIKFETAVLELKPFQGRIADVLIEDAQEWAADVLIIGTHGRRGFSHLFMGSVAENVIRIATMPVLLLRDNPPSKSQKR